MSALHVQIRRTRPSDLPLPSYATPGAAGMDLRADLDEPLVIEPGAVALVPTGLAIAVPSGFEAQVRSRSGLALKQSLVALNSPGTIDSDYRGEVKVILANLGKESATILRGDRIAQMVVAAVSSVEWQLVDNLDETQRGEGGFGSTKVQ